MRTRSRRRLDIGLLAGGSLVVGAAALIGGCAADQERVVRYWTAAEMAGDGSAQVTEVIDYSFGFTTDKRGIFRVIRGLDPSADVSVSSPDAPDDTEITPEGNDIRVRIGDPSTTVSGRHRYQIGYELPGVRQDDRVDWETMGTDWEVGMDEAEIHLVTPFVLESAQCFKGRTGSSAGCGLTEVEPGHVVATVDGLSAGEGVSIEGDVGAPLAAAPAAPAPPTGTPDDPGTGPVPPAGTAAAAAAIAALPVTLMVRRAGRERVYPGGAADVAFGGPARPGTAAPAGRGAVPPPPPVPGATGPNAAPPSPPTGSHIPATSAPTSASTSVVRIDATELGRLATTEFAPPDGVSPAHGGIVLREEVRNEHKVAWLIQAAIDGVIEIDDTSGTRIRRIPGAPATAEQQPILTRMFATGPTIELGKYDKDFASGWTMVGSRLDWWRRHSGLWDARADVRRVLVRVLGLVAGVAGLVVAAAGGLAAGRFGAAWLPVAVVGGLLAGAGWAAAVGAWELHVRTPEGSALWLRIESFRRFLAGSEAYHAEEAAKRGVLREYTAWALAVGEIDRWSSAVRASTIAPDVAGVHYAYMAPVLMSSTTSTATAPSSSGGGGGFGGGSVGGGAGGGGGGSW